MGLSISKLAILRLSRAVGLFKAARHRTRKSLRVLCYHGTAIANEAAFRPQLFIEQDAFRRHLEHLRSAGYPVLTLDEGVRRLGDGTLPDNAVVVTIDDGFFSTFQHAVPELARLGIPATLYVTTYYSQKQEPVFRLLLQYIFWATKKGSLQLDGLGLEGLHGIGQISADRENDKLLWDITRLAETAFTEPQRKALATEIADRLHVPIANITDGRLLGLMTSEEIQAAEKAGVAIELHTHRHRLPVNERETKKEVQENRAILEPLVGRPLNHFCYPSGEYSQEHLAWLRELGIASATTCDTGFNAPGTDPLLLKRVFDSAEVSDLQFEAEMSGYLEMLRDAKAMVAKFRGKRRATTSAIHQPGPSAIAANS